MYSLNKLSYPQRLFVWLLGYSLLMVGYFVVFQYHREKEFKAEEIDKQLQLINTYILNELSEGYDVPDIKLDEFKPFDNIRVSVISDKGHIIYDNTLDSLPKTNHLDRQEIRNAVLNGSGYAVRRHSESTGNYYFYSAKKSDEGNIVRTAVPYSVSFSGLLQADYGFLWIMGIITLVMCILGYFATRRVGLHIIRLNRFAENVENGAPRLQQAVADRDSEHRAALHEQLEKERIKKQLTNNINHELKTPVASIRVSVETMITHRDLSEEKQMLFLQRCLTNTERLQRLLTDVSLLTRMDDGSASIIKEQVNLTDIINDVVEDRQIIAATKGMTIENYISRNIVMDGNPSLLEAVFNNLIDNAIVYSGGTKIKIELIGMGSEKVVIALSDNGCGVLSEHLPRLFERFYRIDKGRSRAAGGTGLGLSIVKNAVVLHGGEITAENQNSGGLLFKMTFSRK